MSVLQGVQRGLKGGAWFVGADLVGYAGKGETSYRLLEFLPTYPPGLPHIFRGEIGSFPLHQTHNVSILPDLIYK